MKGLLLVQHYSQVNLRRSKKTVSSTGVQNCNDTPLVRKKAQKTARKTSAERNNQYYLLGCPCHGGYKLYSLLRGTKTKTEQKPTKIAQIPKKAARRNARSLTEHADPAVTKAAPAFPHIQLRYLFPPDPRPRRTRGMWQSTQSLPASPRPPSPWLAPWDESPLPPGRQC